MAQDYLRFTLNFNCWGSFIYSGTKIDEMRYMINSLRMQYSISLIS